ncbi:type II secretion system protein [Mobilitalea sibirica]|uniref:Type II secretion system protein n=1 Tax=Mobilitalea sibirica TaxID=1462919 RepID=A0A8J7L215_9FIRM|nr:prepilin-type N-terminal cleavage/methylation domain-containing protein [Mobilitalea sibirica]MBH1939788.1 type II secretion system protein [Mobilitalea sibirica]
MKDNRGITLIELLVVMIIIGVLGGASIFGARILGLGTAKSSTGRISAFLDYVQVENMTKNKIYYMIIKKGNDKDYYLIVETADGTVVRSEKLDLVRGEITFYKKNDPTKYSVKNLTLDGEEVNLEVSFLKESGGIRENRSHDKVTQIGISSAGRSYSIRLVEVTGRHYID